MNITEVDATALPEREIPSRWDVTLNQALAIKPGRALMLKPATWVIANQIRAVVSSRHLPLDVKKRGAELYLIRSGSSVGKKAAKHGG
jgi:hypothetical protein